MEEEDTGNEDQAQDEDRYWTTGRRETHHVIKLDEYQEC